jgi:hypothetical protein
VIETTYFAKYFTELLNKYGADYGKHFKVFADEGELQKATKNYGEAPKDYTSGIVEVISSSLIPVRDIRINTFSVQVTLFVDLALNGFNEEKESLNLMDIRTVLTNIIESINGTTEFVSFGEKKFNQSITVNYPTNGQKTDIGFISDCLPIFWTFNLALTEDGINANDCKLLINGTDINFTRMVLTRKRTADSQNFNGDTSQKTIIQANGLSVDLVVPVQDNDISRLFMQDVLDGGNFALNIEIETPLYTKRFIGTFGDTQASLDIASNVGGNMSIVEAKENVLDYQYTNKWTKYITLEQEFELEAKTGDVIYFGDGIILKVEEDGIVKHTFIDQRKKHTIRKFGG